MLRPVALRALDNLIDLIQGSANKLAEGRRAALYMISAQVDRGTPTMTEDGRQTDARTVQTLKIARFPMSRVLGEHGLDFVHAVNDYAENILVRPRSKTQRPVNEAVVILCSEMLLPLASPLHFQL